MTPSLQSSFRIALVGDYNSAAIAHQAIPLALAQSAAALDLAITWHWVSTTAIHHSDDLAGYDGIWCVPASPYKSEQGALSAIRYARENQRPFLGTCGGFQHAIIEYARQVLGWQDAGHGETTQEGRLVIVPLVCSLVEKSDAIKLKQDSLAGKAYGSGEICEGYHCNYGIDPVFAAELNDGPLTAVGWDGQGEVRAIELQGHPFFVATLFQHERRALSHQATPLVMAFLAAVKQQTKR